MQVQAADDDSWDASEPNSAAGQKKSATKKLTYREKRSKQQTAKSNELNDDFLSFDQVPENAFISTEFSKPGGKEAGREDESSELETRIAKKFDKSRYPWLSKRTLKIKDIFLFLHSEILDFVEFVSQSEAEKRRR